MSEHCTCSHDVLHPEAPQSFHGRQHIPSCIYRFTLSTCCMQLLVVSLTTCICNIMHARYDPYWRYVVIENDEKVFVVLILSPTLSIFQSIYGRSLCTGLRHRRHFVSNCICLLGLNAPYASHVFCGFHALSSFETTWRLLITCAATSGNGHDTTLLLKEL